MKLLTARTSVTRMIRGGPSRGVSRPPWFPSACMRRHGREIGRPRVGVSAAEDQLAGLAEDGAIVRDHRVHEEQIHQVQEWFSLRRNENP